MQKKIKIPSSKITCSGLIRVQKYHYTGHRRLGMLLRLFSKLVNKEQTGEAVQPHSVIQAPYYVF